MNKETGMGPETSPDGLPEAPIFSPSYKLNPYAWYREWVTRPPFWATVAGSRAVMAARFRDVEAIYRDHESFSSVKPQAAGMERFDFFNGYRDLVHTDPPDHTRLRAIINPAMLPDAIARLEPHILSAAEELLDGIASGDGTFELMSRFAHPFSAATLLGVLLDMPPGDFPVLVRLARAMGQLGETAPGAPKPRAYLDAWEAGRRYCLDVIEKRRSAPGNDLIGKVVRAQQAGTLSTDELFVMLIGLFIGGVGSVATVTGNAIIQLLSHEGQYRALCENPGLAPNAVEEVLRFDSAGLFNYKFARHDCVFEGLSIPAGSTIYLIMQAAGFDPTVHDDPFRFDIRRPIRRHLSMGYGIHACVGAPIARTALRVALTSITRRFPRLRRIGDHPIEYGGWEQERAPLALGLRFD